MVFFIIHYSILPPTANVSSLFFCLFSLCDFILQCGNRFFCIILVSELPQEELLLTAYHSRLEKDLGKKC